MRGARRTGTTVAVVVATAVGSGVVGAASAPAALADPMPAAAPAAAALPRAASPLPASLFPLALRLEAVGTAALGPAVGPAIVPLQPSRASLLPAQAAPAAEDGSLRVAHLSPSTGAVDMYAMGPGLPLTKIASDVSYSGITPYLPARPGVYTLQARPAGADRGSPPALATSVAVGPDSAQTAAFVDTGADGSPQAEVIDDGTAPAPAGRAAVRVIAAADGVGPLSVTAQGGGPIARGVFYGAASAYATVDARTWTMDVTTTTGETTQLTLPVASTSVSSVIVSRDAHGALTAGAVPDAASAATGGAAAGSGAPTAVTRGLPVPAAPAPGSPAASVPGSAAPVAPGSAAPGAAAPTLPRGGVPAGFGAAAGVVDPVLAPMATPMTVLPAATPAAATVARMPTGLSVPGVGIAATSLTDLALDAQDRLQAPATPHEVGWFSGGAVPGDRGTAVLVGHVDSWRGPGVFFDLQHVRAGDPIDVPRSDGTVAHFVVDSVGRFDKDAFPTDRVYAPTAGPSLRLITCGGPFDRETRSYEDNVVVFASPAPAAAPVHAT